MKNKIVYRALVFEDDRTVRALLWEILDRRGYEVFTFPHPGACPHYKMKNCPCRGGRPCTDMIISDVDMPVSNGLDFVEEQMQKGCQCRNIALMSGRWTEQNLAKAKELGLKVFPKPFQLDELAAWFDEVEKRITSGRELSDWWKRQYHPPENDEDG